MFSFATKRKKKVSGPIVAVGKKATRVIPPGASTLVIDSSPSSDNDLDAGSSSHPAEPRNPDDHSSSSVAEPGNPDVGLSSSTVDPGKNIQVEDPVRKTVSNPPKKVYMTNTENYQIFVT